jgi:glycosyltransferase involved in cell wall biosynthesis
MLEPWARNHKWLKKRIAWTFYQRRDLDTATRIHATSAVEAANMIGLNLTAPIAVIRNGVDIPVLEDRACGHSFKERTALFLGRIYPVKGLPMLIEAWGEVRPQGWSLKIAGPDEAGHQRKVVERVRVAGLENVVTFVGPVNRKIRETLFNEADLFILPSHSESFGMAVAESLAHAVPVLTTTNVPWSELDARGCGFLSAPNPHDLADALRKATAMTPAQLQAMGSRGREYAAAEFRWSCIAQQFEELYASAATGTGKY